MAITIKYLSATILQIIWNSKKVHIELE